MEIGHPGLATPVQVAIRPLQERSVGRGIRKGSQDRQLAAQGGFKHRPKPRGAAGTREPIKVPVLAGQQVENRRQPLGGADGGQPGHISRGRIATEHRARTGGTGVGANTIKTPIVAGQKADRPGAIGPAKIGKNRSPHSGNALEDRAAARAATEGRGAVDVPISTQHDVPGGGAGRGIQARQQGKVAGGVEIENGAHVIVAAKTGGAIKAAIRREHQTGLGLKTVRDRKGEEIGQRAAAQVSPNRTGTEHAPLGTNPVKRPVGQLQRTALRGGRIVHVRRAKVRQRLQPATRRIREKGTPAPPAPGRRGAIIVAFQPHPQAGRAAAIGLVEGGQGGEHPVGGHLEERPEAAIGPTRRRDAQQTAIAQQRQSALGGRTIGAAERQHRPQRSIPQHLENFAQPESPTRG